MKPLAAEFGFAYMPFYDDSTGFQQAALRGSGRRALVLTDRDDIAWDGLPAFRGSHFIRDPRDMVVSGYFYHLWTEEAWCRSPDFDWDYFTALPAFQWVEPDASKWPRNISYQTYLNSLDLERGLLMEMVSRERTFQQMRRWNFERPGVMEFRYEKIIGNEEAEFERLFDHYGFNADAKARGLELVRTLSLKNLDKVDKTHVRSGDPGQWRDHFTPRVNSLFKQSQGNLLIRLGYEPDDAW
ncbi:MAG: sulfotransferase domain-containing protein [Pseudomonadota bacterium]